MKVKSSPISTSRYIYNSLLKCLISQNDPGTRRPPQTPEDAAAKLMGAVAWFSDTEGTRDLGSLQRVKWEVSTTHSSWRKTRDAHVGINKIPHLVPILTAYSMELSSLRP